MVVKESYGGRRKEKDKWEKIKDKRKKTKGKMRSTFNTSHLRNC